MNILNMVPKVGALLLGMATLLAPMEARAAGLFDGNSADFSVVPNAVPLQSAPTTALDPTFNTDFSISGIDSSGTIFNVEAEYVFGGSIERLIFEYQIAAVPGVSGSGVLPEITWTMSGLDAAGVAYISNAVVESSTNLTLQAASLSITPLVDATQSFSFVTDSISGLSFGNNGSITFALTIAPEPGTYLMMGSTLLLAAVAKQRKKQSNLV